jgi:hypothetical protein
VGYTPFLVGIYRFLVLAGFVAVLGEFKYLIFSVLCKIEKALPSL